MILNLFWLRGFFVFALQFNADLWQNVYRFHLISQLTLLLSSATWWWDKEEIKKAKQFLVIVWRDFKQLEQQEEVAFNSFIARSHAKLMFWKCKWALKSMNRNRKRREKSLAKNTFPISHKTASISFFNYLVPAKHRR